jgi:hypothetical protein
MSTIAPNNHAYGMFKNILIQHHTVISLEETGPTCREGNGVAIVFGYLNKFTVTVYEAWLRFTSTANSTLLHMGSWNLLFAELVTSSERMFKDALLSIKKPKKNPRYY